MKKINNKQTKFPEIKKKRLTIDWATEKPNDDDDDDGELNSLHTNHTFKTYISPEINHMNISQLNEDKWNELLQTVTHIHDGDIYAKNDSIIRDSRATQLWNNICISAKIPIMGINLNSDWLGKIFFSSKYFSRPNSIILNSTGIKIVDI